MSRVRRGRRPLETSGRAVGARSGVLACAGRPAPRLQPEPTTVRTYRTRVTRVTCCTMHMEGSVGRPGALEIRVPRAVRVAPAPPVAASTPVPGLGGTPGHQAILAGCRGSTRRLA